MSSSSSASSSSHPQARGGRTGGGGGGSFLARKRAFDKELLGFGKNLATNYHVVHRRLVRMERAFHSMQVLGIVLSLAATILAGVQVSDYERQVAVLEAVNETQPEASFTVDVAMLVAVCTLSAAALLLFTASKIMWTCGEGAAYVRLAARGDAMVSHIRTTRDTLGGVSGGGERFERLWARWDLAERETCQRLLTGSFATLVHADEVDAAERELDRLGLGFWKRPSPFEQDHKQEYERAWYMDVGGGAADAGFGNGNGDNDTRGAGSGDVGSGTSDSGVAAAQEPVDATQDNPAAGDLAGGGGRGGEQAVGGGGAERAAVAASGAQEGPGWERK